MTYAFNNFILINAYLYMHKGHQLIDLPTYHRLAPSASMMEKHDGEGGGGGLPLNLP